ncbi:N-acetylglucosamine-6-phosphate deacetylase [Chroococcidiopsis sp. FACHB-1243]|uniref:N-acetylglucosamine-6-phosphate deacetylase n=1 Tax=Chroococcidiopsis sp. [FACHB-1243] TaxID=2692781 RepID=UPI001785E859|nr:N-acetylglucosamine-6-phosphate deacetylase [Chroococcidiopsis sp. [FACHB-1243]]MBD2307832.1 N-acetylglucosamine-6-phosphate deacetylase [Chroococcidiopsis sp. [FACHB-1243]]
MTHAVDIINARVPGYAQLQGIRIDLHGQISSIEPMDRFIKKIPPADLRIINLAADRISLGGVDLQINGALGLAFTDLQPTDIDKLQKISEYLWKQGIDAYLPTLVTTSEANIQRSLGVIADYMQQQTTSLPTAQVLGVHLEGPFLNPQKRGAHPAEYLLPLTIPHIQQLLGEYARIVKVITLAPELDPTGEAITYLRSLGITVSLGHSLATAIQAEQAFKLGATMVTHAFNAMPGLHHREPGLLGAALVHPQVKCGLIADGQHICPTIIQVLLRAGCYERGIFLVSDALAPLGLPDGVYPWDTRQIDVKNGTARLFDGTLAGTTLPLLVGVQNLVRWNLCDVDTAIALATTAPRQAIDLPTIQLGTPFHQLLRWQIKQDSKELTWKRLQ